MLRRHCTDWGIRCELGKPMASVGVHPRMDESLSKVADGPEQDLPPPSADGTELA